MVARARDLRKQGIAESARLIFQERNRSGAPATAGGFAAIHDRLSIVAAR
jgi:hypothetical protein